MKQIARNVTMEGCGILRDCRYLLLDRDTKFTQSFRAIIASAQVEPLALPARSPNLSWTAMLAGLRTLNPDAARAGLIGAVDLLGHDALCAQQAGVREDGRAVLGDVFIEQDASVGIAQQPCPRGLVVENGANAR